MTTKKEMERQIGVLNNKVFVLERIVDELILAFNTHIHDVIDEPSYGLVSFIPKQLYGRRLKDGEWVTT